MKRYLVVANQTGDSPSLLKKTRQLVEEDALAEFVVLAPRHPAPMGFVLGGDRRNATQLALWRAQRTADRLRSAGAKVVDTRLGGFDPLAAVDQELQFGTYTGVIISTLAPGMSRWLHLDLPSKLRARWPLLDVIQVTAPTPYHVEREENLGTMPETRTPA